MNTTLKKKHFLIIVILLIFTLNLFFFSKKLFKSVNVFQFERLSLSDQKIQSYIINLNETNELILNSEIKNQLIFLNDYKFYNYFENKFEDFEKLNNYLFNYNNINKKDFKINKEDISYIKIKSDSFQLRYYGDDLVKFTDFINFMNQSIKNELITQTKKSQLIISKNIIFEEKKFLEILNRDYLFYESLYLYNLKFLSNNKNKSYLIPSINKLGCLYFLGFQHENSEIQSKIEIFLKNRSSYILKDFETCKIDQRKKELERMNLEVHLNFIQAIEVMNSKLINVKQFNVNRFTLILINKFFMIFTIIFLILFLFFYNDAFIYFTKKNLNKYIKSKFKSFF